MNKEDEILLKHFKDLSAKSYNSNIYTFTNFLAVNELAVLYEHEREFKASGFEINGGYDDAERVMVRFGNKEEFGYEEEYPISILEIAPLMEKFSDDLTHRDFLGALMNIGIEREMLGDIVVASKKAYLICHSNMKDFIIENLSKVKHTSVKLKELESVPETLRPAPVEKVLQVQSVRLDAVIAHTYNLSRSQSVELFLSKKVFLNGRQCENVSEDLKPGDKITVRGFGRFVYVETIGTSRKGKENIKILI